MLTSSEKNRMMQAYMLLYEVENYVRSTIEQAMKAAYGTRWFTKAPKLYNIPSPPKSFLELTFSQYEVYYLRRYPIFNLTSSLSHHFCMLYPLRNKVAHHHCLSLYEFQQLKRSSYYVLRELN